MIEHSGIGVRILNLLQSLAKEKRDDLEIYLFGNKAILSKYELDKPFSIIEYNVKVYSLREFWGHSKMKEMDILDIPHFNIPIRYLKKCIVTIHDIIPYKMKEFFPSKAKQIYMHLIFYLIKKFSKKVISVSECTKSDLVEVFHFPNDKIQTIYNGLNQELFKSHSKKECNEFRSKYNLESEYLLTVGIGKGHKNLGFVIKTLTPLWLEGNLDLPLILAGAGGKIPEHLIEIIRPVEKFIIPFQKISYEELPLLYQNAKMLIFPSLYEGFGFPLLEAQGVGCPVLSSNASVMPEVLRNSAYFFNPRDEKKFQEEFRLFMLNPSLLKTKVPLGYENAKRFTWKKAAEETIQVYKEL
jgi:glycosyltransferase involved in cell wall biosynthesis